MRRICVFTGSNPGVRPAYRAAAVALGELLAARGIELVYGGARIGLMGAVADATMAAGGKAIGVIPEGLKAKEVAHEGLDELHVVASMHERKALMAELSDAFIALPGGVGTFEELFEVLTWTQLGLHHKPVGVLDVAGYYQPLLAFLDSSVAQGFVREAHRALLHADTTPDGILDQLAAWEPEYVPKWTDEDQR